MPLITNRAPSKSTIHRWTCKILRLRMSTCFAQDFEDAKSRMNCDNAWQPSTGMAL